MGIFKLSPRHLHRRIDIKVCNHKGLATALHNDRGEKTGTVAGTAIPCAREEQIFSMLGACFCLRLCVLCVDWIGPAIDRSIYTYCPRLITDPID